MFEGLAGGPGSLIKYNPLSNLSSAETWNFLRVMVGWLAGWPLQCGLGGPGRAARRRLPARSPAGAPPRQR